MVIDQLTGRVTTPREEAEDRGEVIRIAGGGVAHEVRKASGEGALSSALEAHAWVGKEMVALERASGRGRRARWQVVGEHRGARAQGGRSRREVGGDEAVCVAEYESREGGPLKVTFRMEAAQAGRYRLRWSLRGLGGRLVESERGLRLRRGDERCVVDWSDVVEGHGEVVSLDAAPVGGADIVFGPFELGVGEAVVLDPTIAEEIYWPTASWFAGSRRLVQTSEGKLYAVYSKRDDTGSSAPTHVYVRESSDGGSTWTNETKLSTLETGDTINKNPSIAVDSRDNLHVVFEAADDQIYYREYTGSGWATAVNISSGTGATSGQACPSMVVDEFDQPHVVWEGIEPGTSRRIWWNTRVGGQWQGPQKISTAGGMDGYTQSLASLAVDGEGDLHVVWQGKATGYTTADQIWYAESVNEEWQTSVRISTATDMEDYQQGYPSVAVGEDGHVHVVWDGKANGYTGSDQIWYAERTTSWQSPERISDAGGMDSENQIHPSIAADADNRLHVLFEGWATGAPADALWVYHVERPSGDSWGTPDATATSGQHRRPNLRWSALFTKGGYVDWLYYDGEAFRYEDHDSDQSVTSVNRKAQSFTAPENRRLSYVVVALKNDGTTRTATMEIREDDGGEPGTLLGSATTGIAATVPTETYFVFDATEVNLTADSIYWIVLYPSSGTIYWRVDSGGGYADGVWAYSTDSGSSWTTDAGIDARFFVAPYFDLCFGEDTGHQLADVADVTAVEDTRYDERDLPTEVIDPVGGVTTMAYDELGLQTGETNPLGESSAFVYDAEEQLTAQVNPLGKRTTHSYDLGGRQIAVEDANNHITSYHYDMADRQTAVEDPLLHRTSYQYDAMDRRTAVIDPLGHTTSYDYQQGRLKAQVDPLGNGTTYSYDPVGNRTSVQDANGNIATFVYDAIYRKTADVDPQLNTTTYEYDIRNNLTAVINALTQTTSYDYDDDGNRIADQDPLGNRTTYVYDAGGRQIAVVDALENRTTTVYNDAGQAIAVVDAEGNRTTSVYDVGGQLIATVDGRSNVASFQYDAAGQLTAEIDPLVQTISYGYDAVGQREWRWDAKAQRTTYVYDEAGRLTTMTYSDGSRVTYSYDAGGNRLTMEDSVGIASYSWDELNRLAVVTYPYDANPGTLTYTYDAVGNRETMVDPEGATTTYSYDSRNLLEWLVNHRSERSTYTYDGLGRVTTLEHHNGTYAETDYDAAGRIEAVRNLKSDDSVISIFTYSYDDAGNRTGVQEANGDRVTWSYDGASQLTRERRSGANSYDLTYTYDGAGNRILEKDSGNLVTYSYDAANQLEWGHRSSPSTARVTYSYDANGNLALINTMGSLTTYTWDTEDRVAQVAPQGGTTNLMVYDGDGKRRVYTDSAMVRTFLWDGENIIRQTLRDYTYNPQAYGELISMGAEEEASYCYHYDALGSTDRVTAANESVVNQYLYRAFGEQTNVIAEGISNRFTWVGRLGYYREPDLSTYWLRARVYEPARGRFISRDPARDDTNLYRWPGNSPVVLVDPSGRHPGGKGKGQYRPPDFYPQGLRTLEEEAERVWAWLIGRVWAWGDYFNCMGSCLGRALLPDLGDVARKWGQHNAKRATELAQKLEEAHIAERGLTTPGRSSIIRGFRQLGRFGRVASKFMGWLALASAVLDVPCIYKCHRYCAKKYLS